MMNKGKIVILLLMVIVTRGTYAQIDLGTFLEGGVEDANKLLENYFEPVFIGVGTGLAGSWYNTGKPHKLLGFDITVNANFAYVPTADQTFTFNNSDYENIKLSDGVSEELPTFAGSTLPAENLPRLQFYDGPWDDAGSTEQLEVSALTGLGLEETSYPFVKSGAIPTAMVQLGIGLMKGTELKFRFFPERSFGDSSEEITAKLFGFGIMHDFKQWIPGLKKLPFDLSIFYGWSNLKTSMNINQDNNSNSDQQAVFNVKGSTFQIIASKKISLLTVYTGLGFISSSTGFQMLGEYETETGTFNDPIDFEYNIGGAKLNFGARMKLLIFTIHAEYAFQKYNTFNLGFGLSIR